MGIFSDFCQKNANVENVDVIDLNKIKIPYFSKKNKRSSFNCNARKQHSQHFGAEEVKKPINVENVENHLNKIGKPQKCKICPAAAYQVSSNWGGDQLLCFAYAYFKHKSGRPRPCVEAKLSCPLIFSKHLEQKNFISQLQTTIDL